MKNVSIFCFIILFIFFLSCKKNKNSSDPTVQVSTISGSIVSPDSSLNVNTLSVLSPIDLDQVHNGQYVIKAYINAYNTTLVINSNGNTVMMGYNIPGSSDNSITVSTTALALVMNTPVVLSLSTTGKQQLIAKVLSDVNFANLELSIKNNVSTGNDLFDTTNTDLMQNLENIVHSVSLLRTTNSTPNSPIYFTQSGRNFTFYNGENIFATAIGIYQNRQKVDSFVLNGEQVFPTSIQDALNGTGTLLSGVNSNDNISYSLQGDGEFDIKISTGLPGFNNGTPEYSQALIENGESLASTVLSYFLPFVGNKSTLSCIANVIGNDLYGNIKDLNDIGNSSSLFYTVFHTVNTHIQTMANCINASQGLNLKYFQVLDKFFYLADRGFALFGGSVNIGFYARQWSLANPNFDTCYSVSGSTFSHCGATYIGNVSQGPWYTFTFNAPTQYTGQLSIINLSVLMTFNHANETVPDSATFTYDVNDIGIPNFHTNGPSTESMTNAVNSSGIVKIYFPSGAILSTTIAGTSVSGNFTCPYLYTDIPSGDTTHIVLSTPITLNQN